MPTNRQTPKIGDMVNQIKPKPVYQKIECEYGNVDYRVFVYSEAARYAKKRTRKVEVRVVDKFIKQKNGSRRKVEHIGLWVDNLCEPADERWANMAKNHRLTK